MKKLLALMLALLMCMSLFSVFAEEELPPEEPSVEVITASIYSDESYTFSERDFNNVCRTESDGKNLSYIMIDVEAVSATDGTLFYDYKETGTSNTKVKATEKYKYNASKNSIGKISFIPKFTFEGEVEIPYKAYYVASGTSTYASYEGTIKISVTAAEIGGDIDLIRMEGKKGGKYKFSINDFEREFNNAGVDMSYIKFTLPSETNGVLYYDYSSSKKTAVSASTAYYLNPSSSTKKDFEKITLVFGKEAADEFDLEYVVYDTDEVDHAGTISFSLEGTGSVDGSYSTQGEAVYLRASDFNTECINNTGSRLKSVKFTKPSSGTLWYDYDDEEGDRATLSTTKSYYYNSNPYLYLVSYVPKDSYKGTVDIDYVATSIDGETYNGTISISVDTKSMESAKTITYSVKNTSYKTISYSTVGSNCKTLTGEVLDYVKFTAPSKGKLYYRYNKSDEYQITSSDRLYYKSADGDYLGNVSYVPAKGYEGTISVSYTGFTVEGTAYKGVIKFTVTGTEKESSGSDDVADIKYSGKVGEAIELDPDDFYDVCDDYAEDDLDYITFTLPSSSSGTIWYDYEGKYEQKIKASDECYYEDDDPLISKISFVPAKSGTISVKYKAYPYYEDEYTGYIKFTVTGGTSTAPSGGEGMGNFTKSKTYKKGLFADIDENEWYGANATAVIKNAYAYGLMAGRTDGNFDPNGNMTVAEAITIAARIADIYYDDNTKFSTTSKNWYDDYVDYAIEYKIIKKTQFKDYNAKITRAEMAVIFANILPEEAMEEINNITSIPDVSKTHANYEEILYLYNVGILLGDDKGNFNPKSNITRAEVSAIITRIVDLDERLEK